LEKHYKAERGGGVVGGLAGLVEHDTIGLFEGEVVRPIGHQGGEQILDQVRGHTVPPLPYRVGGHVRPRGRRWGGAGKGPADLVKGQGEAVPKWEQDGVDKPGRFAGEKVLQKGFVEFRRSGSAWEFRETGWETADGKLLGRPDSLLGCCGQERGPVVPFGLLDGFEIGRSSRPCGS